MAESKQETDLETIYDEKERRLEKWGHNLYVCGRLLNNIGLNPNMITEFHDMTPVKRAIRYTDREIENLTEGSAIWIRYIGYQTKFNEVCVGMPTLEGRDYVTGKRIFSPYTGK